MDNFDKMLIAEKDKLQNHPTGHTWKLDKDGALDVFVLDFGNHNGPGCVKCGYSYCHHCQAEPTEDCSYKGQAEIPSLEDSGVREK